MSASNIHLLKMLALGCTAQGSLAEITSYQPEVAEAPDERTGIIEITDVLATIAAFIRGDDLSVMIDHYH